MRKFWPLMLAAVWMAAAPEWVRADVNPVDYTFLLSAEAVASPPSITIRWAQKSLPAIYVRRKLLGEANWGGSVTLNGSATSYVDTSVVAGKAYEYEFQGVVQANPQQIAYGYICAGASVPAQERRGKLVLVVDNRFAGSLAAELETLRKDLVGDGWTVLRRDVSPASTSPQVKAIIRNEYNADPANVKAVFLFGHVAVPYSGLINPDMHPTHLGAWPADLYYGEMDGAWTDYSVNKNDAEYSWNNNVPGDGKFDQSIIPSDVDLEVGRVDFWDMPSFTRGEQELLRNYLNKDHAFRHRTLNAEGRGLIRDNFGTIDGDAPAADAWRAFPALFGANNYLEVGSLQFFPTLQNQTYLFAYAGGGGDWEKADGVGTTKDFVNGDPKAIFYMLHGSWFGDWDNTDNFLRAAIATPTYGLVSIWTSLPHWYFHPMAMGETIGYVTRMTQNNRNGIYRNSADLSNGQTHVSMMGDPTLRAFPLAPPSNFRLTVTDQLTFSWDPSVQPVNGYEIYVASSYDGPFEKARRGAVPATSVTIPMLPAGHYVFMVRAAALQTTGSGSFNNLSQGIFLETDVNGTPPTPPPPTPVITVAATDAIGNENGDAIIFTLTRNAATDVALDVNLQFSGTATPGEDYQSVATAKFAAGSATATVTIVPTNDGINEMDESVVLTVGSGAGYDLGSPNSASATIKESGEARILGAKVSEVGQFGFRAVGFANRPYIIQARTPTSAWYVLGSGVCGADGSITYQENIAASANALFYRVICQ